MSTKWRRCAAAAALILSLAAGCATKQSPNLSPSPAKPQTEEEKVRGPAPREGPAEQMDPAMEHMQSIRAFPAKTAGQGAQPLTPRIENGVKVFDLETKIVQWEVEPGAVREAWTFNGTVPGPLIRVTEGDRVRINLKNSLKEPTAMHLHGMRLLNNNAMDGVSYLTTEPTKVGETTPYDFVADPSGSLMYHSHFDSTKQTANGMYGPLIVEPKEKSGWPRYDREYTQILNDGPLGFTINGKSFPATSPITAKLGEKVLVRWMNIGAMAHPMHLHGTRMSVVAKDGALLPAPIQMDTLNIAPGERYDVLLTADNPGKWAWHCHILPHAEGDKGMYGLVTVFIVEK